MVDKPYPLALLAVLLVRFFMVIINKTTINGHYREMEWLPFQKVEIAKLCFALEKLLGSSNIALNFVLKHECSQIL